MANRVYHEKERPDSVHRDIHSLNKYFFLRIGRIIDLDYDKYTMKVEWYGGGGQSSIPISFAYVGPAGCIGMVPEKGALGLFAYRDGGRGSPPVPYCVSFLPAGLALGLEFNVGKEDPNAVSNEDQNETLHRFRKIELGDMVMASPLGAELLLNDNVLLQDSKQDSIRIRQGDQAIISTSLNNYIFSDGASVSAGPIVRNNLLLYDTNGKRIELSNGRDITMPDGSEVTYIVPFGEKIRYDTQFYSEYRIDVDEIVDGKLDSNSVNSEIDLSTRSPILTVAMGNYVGANSSDYKTYGKILKPIFFSSSLDTEGSFKLAQALQNNELNEPTTLGLAYALHFLKSGAFMGFDKQGHYYLNLPASTSANPLGGGRSMSILAAGNRKEVWGMAAADGNSWDYSAKGGVRWNIGKHNGNGKDTSFEFKTESSVRIEIGGETADEPGQTPLAKEEIIQGNVSEKIVGSRDTDIGGTSSLTIQGLKEETVYGSATEIYQVDKTEHVMGISAEIVIKEKQSRCGKRKTTVLGDDKLTVMKGDITENIKLFGNKKTTLTKGDIEETILLGNRKTKILVGNCEISTLRGNVEIKATTGNMNISGLKTNVSSTTKAVFSALKTSIGPKTVPLGGGAITGLPGSGPPSHFDYVTGIPHKGSFTVSLGG